VPTRASQREPLSHRVAESVLAFVREQGLEPGAVLPSEARLGARFGVSRPVVREALRMLDERGVVDVVNGRGAVLRPLDSRPLRTFFAHAVEQGEAGAVAELMEVRRGIEVQAARLAAERRTPEQLAELRGLAADMRDALGEPDVYVRLDTEFHMQLAEATQNRMIVHLMRSIRPIVERSIDEGFRARTDPAHAERAHARHEALCDDLERGDAAAAAQTMAEHFDDAVLSLISHSG
jgi:GntR family transcriptional regulator, transcriptional repressor for pyruvate dehydrogenase complex